MSAGIRIAATGAATGAPAMFPGAARAGDAIVVAYSTVPDGWPGGEVQVIRSTDGGETWSEPVATVSAHPGEDAVLGAVGLARLADGTLLLPVNAVTWTEGQGAGGRQASLRLLRSVDDGVSWTGDSTVDLDFAWPAVYGEIIERADGELLWPVWGYLRRGERWRSTILSSVDGGGTWRLKSTIAYDPTARLSGAYVDSGNTARGDDPDEVLTPEFRPHDPTDGFSETSVTELPDGRLIAVLRQQGVGGDDRLTMFVAWSDDGGETWSPYRSLGFSGMSPVLARGPGDSLLLLTRRHVPEGSDVEPAVELRRSDDGGQTWDAPVPLRDPHGTRLTAEYQCGYPAVVPEDDGLRVFFYSFLPEGGRFIAWNRLVFD